MISKKRWQVCLFIQSCTFIVEHMSNFWCRIIFFQFLMQCFLCDSIEIIIKPNFQIVKRIQKCEQFIAAKINNEENFQSFIQRVQPQATPHLSLFLSRAERFFYFEH